MLTDRLKIYWGKNINRPLNKVLKNTSQCFEEPLEDENNVMDILYTNEEDCTSPSQVWVKLEQLALNFEEPKSDMTPPPGFDQQCAAEEIQSKPLFVESSWVGCSIGHWTKMFKLN